MGPFIKILSIIIRVDWHDPDFSEAIDAIMWMKEEEEDV